MRFVKKLMLVSLLGSLFICFLAYRAWARLSDVGSTLESGLFEALLPVRDSLSPAAEAQSYRISVNGATLLLARSSFTAAEQNGDETLIERMKQSCRPLEHESAPDALPLGGMPLLVTRGQGQTHVACFRLGFPLTLSGFQKALQRYQKNGDLSVFGGFQSALLRKDGEHHSLLTVESLGPWVVSRMFPETGDAPGLDPEALPRPIGRRVLSVLRDSRAAAVVYESEGSTEQLLVEYEQQLRQAGLSVGRPRRGKRPPSQAFVVSTKDAEYVVTARSDAKEPSRAQLYVARLP